MIVFDWPTMPWIIFWYSVAFSPTWVPVGFTVYEEGGIAGKERRAIGRPGMSLLSPIADVLLRTIIIIAITKNKGKRKFFLSKEKVERVHNFFLIVKSLFPVSKLSNITYNFQSL